MNDVRGGMSLQGGNGSSDLMRKRTLFEALGWAALIAFLWTVDTFAKISYRSNTGFGKDNFRLISDQATSATAVLVMVLFVVYWLRLFPVRKDTWTSAIIGHTVGSVIFAFGHQILMIIQRVAVFAFKDMTYHWQEGFVSNLIVEYQKDVKIYVGIVAVMTAYQFYRHIQSNPTPRVRLTNRLVVQTGTGEAVLAYEEIDYIEASRNYLEVHVGEKEYLIRDTAANLEKRLADGPFARSHRGYIVNLDKVAEIKMVDGSLQILLKNGAALPLSRSYRDAFKLSIAAS